MIAALVTIGPIGWVSIVAGSFIVMGAVGCGIGRAIKLADDALVDDTQPASYPPPVPPSLPRLAPDEDAEWFYAFPADTPLSVIEDAYYDKEFWAIPEVAADMGWAS